MVKKADDVQTVSLFSKKENKRVEYELKTIDILYLQVLQTIAERLA